MSGGLAEADRVLVEVSAALASRDPGAIERALGEAARRGADPEAVEETLLQAYLFLGYPATLEGLAAWRRISGSRPGRSVDVDPAVWPARGEEVCRRVYGGQYGRLRERVRELHPDLERWMLVEGYGKVLGRAGLPLPARELSIVALLAVLGAGRQLHSHLRGALNTGSGEDEIEETLVRALRHAPPEAARTARATWDEVRTRWRAKGGRDVWMDPLEEDERP